MRRMILGTAVLLLSVEFSLAGRVHYEFEGWGSGSLDAGSFWGYMSWDTEDLPTTPYSGGETSAYYLEWAHIIDWSITIHSDYTGSTYTYTRPDAASASITQPQWERFTVYDQYGGYAYDQVQIDSCGDGMRLSLYAEYASGTLGSLAIPGDIADPEPCGVTVAFGLSTPYRYIQSGYDVELTRVETSSVPLPPAALAGLGLLGGFAFVRRVRRRRAA